MSVTLRPNTLLDVVPDLINHISSVDHVIDIGAGIRPATWVKASRHVCIEPCALYAEALAASGFEVIRGSACAGLVVAEKSDLVLMLDVIEHMTKSDGIEALRLASEKAERIIVYTPYGFVEQTHDAWDLGQDYWQTHRSGWLPDEFPNWKILRGKKGFAAVSA